MTATATTSERSTIIRSSGFGIASTQLDADPRLYTTPIAMDDIDDVRAYLGYELINLWGGSYGTRAALVYLKRHEAPRPQRRARWRRADGHAPAAVHGA